LPGHVTLWVRFSLPAVFIACRNEACDEAVIGIDGIPEMESKEFQLSLATFRRKYKAS
jgi:hypothetical protein